MEFLFLINIQTFIFPHVCVPAVRRTSPPLACSAIKICMIPLQCGQQPLHHPPPGVDQPVVELAQAQAGQRQKLLLLLICWIGVLKIKFNLSLV